MDAVVKVDGSEKSIVFNNGYTVKMDNLTDVTDGQKVSVSVRPEELVINSTSEGGSLTGTVLYSTFLGLNTHYIVELSDGSRAEIIQESQIDDIIENGTQVNMTVKAEKINVFTEDGEKTLVK